MSLNPNVTHLAMDGNGWMEILYVMQLLYFYKLEFKPGISSF